MVGRLHVSTEVSTVYFDRLALTAKLHALQLAGHRLAELVRQDESRFVLAPEVAGESKRGLPFDFIDENRDRREVVAERHLVEGKQGAAGHTEILPACLAAPARGAIGFPAAKVGAKYGHSSKVASQPT